MAKIKLYFKSANDGINLIKREKIKIELIIAIKKNGSE